MGDVLRHILRLTMVLAVTAGVSRLLDLDLAYMVAVVALSEALSHGRYRKCGEDGDE